MKTVSREQFDFAVSHFRHLHSNPELGFELPETAAYVTRVLQSLGLETTDRYGQCSVVAQIGSDPAKPTIAFRADMDALPVDEKTDVPYKSRNPGKMHACGHDSHTAILLTAAKILKERENELNCNVRLLFQPSEEGAVSGAKMMVDNGVMEGVENVVCTHCELTIPTGSIGTHVGGYMAACIPIDIRFHGRTAHATLPHAGIDALAMAVEAYNALKAMVKEEAGQTPYIWSVGRLTSGDVHNVIPDLSTMAISFRFYDEAFARRVMEKAEAICKDIAASYGGTVELDWRISTVAVINDAASVERVRKAAAQAQDVTVTEVPGKMSSEDFAWYLTKAPGMLFRFGSLNEEKGCTAQPHRNDFKLDEEGMKAAICTFVNYALNYNT